MKIICYVAASVVLCASPAHALCSYDGVDYAKTTIAREFTDSRWVVKAKVIAAQDDFSGENGAWTVYQLEVQHAYKGRPPHRLRFLTTRDSGGFYMDKAWIRLPAGHDIGGEYLLFLNPLPSDAGLPKVARGAIFVNYSCGLSGPWREVSQASRRELLRLER